MALESFQKRALEVFYDVTLEDSKTPTTLDYLDALSDAFEGVDLTQLSTVDLSALDEAERAQLDFSPKHLAAQEAKRESAQTILRTLRTSLEMLNESKKKLQILEPQNSEQQQELSRLRRKQRHYGSG
jgi:hypothetical protein